MGREARVEPSEAKWVITGDLIAGGLAGLCCDLVLHPVDTVKCRLQAQKGPPFRYRSMIHGFRSIFAQEGIRRGLYAGFGAVLAGSIPTHAIMFATYKSVKRTAEVGAPDAQLPLIDLASGAIGEVCALPTYTPAEVIAKRMQVAALGPARNYRSTVHAARVIHATEGYSGLFAGLWPTMLRDVPYTALQFSLFTHAKDYYRLLVDRPYLHDAEATGLGFVVGAIAATLTNPFDVVKTRMQIQASGSERMYHSVAHCFRRMITEEGFMSLTRGVVPRVMWVAPGSAITLGVFEAVSRYLRELRTAANTAATN